jgi:hypothetical protein
MRGIRVANNNHKTSKTDLVAKCQIWMLHVLVDYTIGVMIDHLRQHRKTVCLSHVFGEDGK